MATIVDAIKDRINNLNLLITRLRESIASRPEGRLQIAIERGNTRFYNYAFRKERQYLRKGDENTLRDLAQKEYEVTLLETAETERSKLLDLQKSLIVADPNTVFQSLDDRIRKYVRPELSSDDAFARKWLETEFEQQRTTEYHKFETLRKDMVRSKSEALIADRLYSEGIPYRYEQVLRLGKGFSQIVFFPDFTVLNKRTRKLYYWEHLGLLGDRNYCLDNLSKLDTYAQYGIIQGKNLILTFESEGKPLSMAYVKKMIKEFLA